MADEVGEEVDRALTAAVDENGYSELLEWPVERIVDDLLDCDASLEGKPPETIKPHVEAWLAKRREKQG